MDAFDQSWLTRPARKVVQRGPQDLIPPRWRVFWLPLCLSLTLLMVRSVSPQAPPVQEVGNGPSRPCEVGPQAGCVGQANDKVELPPAELGKSFRNGD